MALAVSAVAAGAGGLLLAAADVACGTDQIQSGIYRHTVICVTVGVGLLMFALVSVL